MSQIWAVIPSAHRGTLYDVVTGCGLPRRQVVVVATSPARDVPAGVNVIQDHDQVNIHRWWNRGIGFAESNGATHVAVLNDDIRLFPDVLPAMAAELDRTAADVCWTGPDGVSGHCFMLPAGGLRPDETYRWWFGDTDLDRRAAERFGTCRAGGVEHLFANVATEASPELRALAQRDRELFDARWPVSA